MKTYQNYAMTDAETRQALADACKAAPAVVFAFGLRAEGEEAAAAVAALAHENKRFIAISLAEPDALTFYPFAAATISAWDRTEPAMRAVCGRMM